MYLKPSGLHHFPKYLWRYVNPANARRARNTPGCYIGGVGTQLRLPHDALVIVKCYRITEHRSKHLVLIPLHRTYLLSERVVQGLLFYIPHTYESVVAEKLSSDGESEGLDTGRIYHGKKKKCLLSDERKYNECIRKKEAFFLSFPSNDDA